MKSRFGAQLLAFVVVGALAGGGFGASAAGASSADLPNFAGTYTLHYQFGAQPFSTGSLTLTADHGGSDTWGDTVAWAQSGRTGRQVKITFSNPGSSTIATYTGLANAKGFDKKAKPGIASLNNGQQGTWYAVLLPDPPPAP